MKALISAVLLAGLLAAPAAADEFVIPIGGDKTAGAALAQGEGAKWTKSLTKGVRVAKKILAKGGETTVVLKLAAGDYKGDLGSGAYQFPTLSNKEAHVRIEGGYSADFKARDPFGTPTRILTIQTRSAPLIQLHPSQPEPAEAQKELKSLVIDGLLCDVGDSNNYDKASGSLLKGGGTAAHTILGLGNTRVGSFELRNCVFLNSPERALKLELRPAGEGVKFRIFNSVFLNCVAPLHVGSSGSKGDAAVEVEVARCSFVLGWLATADLKTPSAGAIELGTKDQVTKVTIRDSLFYANGGAAIQLPEKNAPILILRRNNFVGNGLVNQDSTAGAAALLTFEHGKPVLLTADKVSEAESVKENEGNVSISPGLALSLVGSKDVPGAKETWEQALVRLLGKPEGEAEVPALAVYAPKLVYDPKAPLLPTVAEAHSYGASPKHVE
jgi:hypothetical protein